MHAFTILAIGFIAYTLYKLFTTRDHVLVGYAFLHHAKEVFSSVVGGEQAVSILDTSALPIFEEFQTGFKFRIPVLVIGILSVSVMIGANWLGVSNGYFALSGAVGLISAGFIYMELNNITAIVDEICNACDADLVDIDRPGEYQAMLDIYEREGPPTS